MSKCDCDGAAFGRLGQSQPQPLLCQPGLASPHRPWKQAAALPRWEGKGHLEARSQWDGHQDVCGRRDTLASCSLLRVRVKSEVLQCGVLGESVGFRVRPGPSLGVCHIRVACFGQGVFTLQVFKPRFLIFKMRVVTTLRAYRYLEHYGK